MIRVRGMGRLLVWQASLCLCGPMGLAAESADFDQVVDGFGELEWIAGLGDNEEPLDNNDWLPAFEGASARSVELSNPHFAAGDALGRIYVADKASHSILRIEPDGRLFTHAGTHVAGTGAVPAAPATTIALDSPNGLFVKPDGTVFIYDTGNHRVRRVAPDGTMTTLINDAAPGYSGIGRGLWVSPDEKLIYYSDGRVVKRWAAGVTTVVASGLLECSNLDVDPTTGLLHVTDRASEDVARSAVWRIENDGTRSRVAGNGALSGGGDGALATETFLDQVRGIAFTPNGGYFLCTHKGGDIWYVDTAGVIHLFIQGRGTGNRNEANGMRPPIVTVDALSEPRSVSIAPNGDLLIATNDTGTIRRVRSVIAPDAPAWLHVDLPVHGNHHLQWVATPGRAYLIERAPTLDAKSWEVLGVATPTSTVGTWSGPPLLNTPSLFYRLSPPR